MREHSLRSTQLFADYNYWRAFCSAVIERRSQHKLNDLAVCDEALEELEAMAAWCEERGLDPRLWLYTLFRVFRWFWPPRLIPGVLRADKHVREYDRGGRLDAYRRHILADKPLAPFDPNVETSPTTEARKAHFAAKGEAQRCFELALENTFGYHPDSETCRRCPLGPQCAEKLTRWATFDIMALRSGQLSREQAIAQVREAQERGRRA